MQGPLGFPPQNRSERSGALVASYEDGGPVESNAFRLHAARNLTIAWLENGGPLNEPNVFPSKDRDILASYVSLPEF